MDFDKLYKLANSINQSVENNEKLAIPLLSLKLHKAAESYPYDQTIGTITDIVDQLSARQATITRSDFKSLYNKLYHRGTKFAEFFQEELGVSTQPATTNTAKVEKPVQKELKSVADPVLANAFASAFEKAPLRLFSAEVAKKAITNVNTTLDAWNLKPAKLNVESGNEHFLVVKADYDTPKGITSLLVPVEVHGQKALEPSLFVGNKGPQDLDNTNIKSYITQFAGQKLEVSASNVVDILTETFKANGDPRKLMGRLGAAKVKSNPLSQDEVVGKLKTQIDRGVENALQPANKQQFASFAEKFSSPLGTANFDFGTEKVDLGRDLISRTVLSFGFSNPQISVVGSDQQTIYYAVSIGGKTAFKVPIKFANNRIIPPEVIICNGTVSSFDGKTLHQLLKNGTTDHKALAATSAQYGLKSSELIDNVRQAMAEENYQKAEDALNVLAETDERAYKLAFQAYMNGMNIVKSAAKEMKCAMAIKSPVSQHTICGHTGLPLHKVYQDEHGNCHPLYRRAMKDDGLSATYIMNYKIFG